MRSLARESVFKYLFSRLFNPDDEGLFDVLIKELKDEDKQFATELLQAVLSDEEKYLNDIERLAIGYQINRLHAADKCALMLGIAELDKFANVPVAIVIDETVNIAAKYSTENSTDFVNGILAQYVKEK